MQKYLTSIKSFSTFVYIYLTTGETHKEKTK